VLFSLATLAVVAFAAWLAVLVLQQSHFPSTAAYPVAALSIGALVLLATYTARLAVRGASCRATAEVTGIVVHNLKGDLGFAWQEIARFEVATDPWGVWGKLSPNPFVVAQVVGCDGSRHFIEGTRRGGAVWRRHQRRREVAGSVAHLESLRQRAVARHPVPGRAWA
jgi:hypothetical protein